MTMSSRTRSLLAGALVAFIAAAPVAFLAIAWCAP
ncbi:hypothetical protein EKPJFOCH_1024 [Methylobacterium thuringiense]|uniref:ABC transporter permease n=1 Tax=Methylobacterium thuringiense TaxID=1003091 RepID=A0ABQ4THX7_9HYPH|nr:hypothetical protein EKPJFOCH_1024 [Methylobacterium thuringiense]